MLEGAAAINDSGYADYITGWSFDYYCQRVKRMSLTGYANVLDVGCGYGHWSAALALENGSVIATEVHEGRLGIAAKLAAHLALDNIATKVANALDLPFDDESFDIVFCYGVVMLIDRETAMAELKRVLRPGGKLYVCLNGPGWWQYLAIKHRKTNKPLARLAWRAFRHGNLPGKKPNWIAAADINSLFDPTAWEPAHVGGEGELAQMEGVYPVKPNGLDHVIEFIVTKRGQIKRADCGVNARTLGVVEEVLGKVLVEPERVAARLPMPRPVLDLVTNRPELGIARLVVDTMKVDRVSLLKEIFPLICGSAKSDRDRILACVRFAQLRFHHHFAGQPMLGETRPMTDPIMALLFGACRCGNAARFLVDILSVNGFRARLVVAACHTSAEAWLDNKWRLIDASLYPPGVIPVGSDGDILCLDEALINPDLLNKAPNYINYHTAFMERFRADYPEAYPLISNWLERPILPSVGYFGIEFQENAGDAIVRRYEKTGTEDSWNARDDFGWPEMALTETCVVPYRIDTEQRPQQVTHAWREGDLLQWNTPHHDDQDRVTYQVFLSAQPRNWSYEAFPIGHNFAVLGAKAIACNSTQLLLDNTEPVFVTIIAQRTDWQDREIFYLPSAEFHV